MADEATRNYFYIETSRDGKSWRTDTYGLVQYMVPSEEAAGLEWARKLAIIHPHVLGALVTRAAGLPDDRQSEVVGAITNVALRILMAAKEE